MPRRLPPLLPLTRLRLMPPLRQVLRLQLPMRRQARPQRANPVKAPRATVAGQVRRVTEARLVTELELAMVVPAALVMAARAAVTVAARETAASKLTQLRGDAERG